MAEDTSQGHQIPIRWCFPEGTVARYATNLVVQHTEHEFVISFFEAFPPLLLGPEEDVRQQLAEVDHIDAECVGRIVVAAHRMPAFVETLQQALERLRTKQEE